MATALTSGLVLWVGTDNVTMANFNAQWTAIDNKFKNTGGHTHDGTDGNGPKITSVGLAAGAATDAVLGNRTIDQATATAFANTGTLTQILSWFGKQLDLIVGETNWYDAPNTSLADAATHAAATTGVHGATSAATANKLAIRDGNGRMQAADPSANADVATKSYVDGKATPAATAAAKGSVLVTTAPASGDPVAASVVASPDDTALSTTAETSIASFTPTAAGNYWVGVYLRVVTGATTVTVKVTYADVGGAQTTYIMNAQSLAVGAYSCLPLFINVVSGTAIDVRVTASVASRVDASASIMGV